MGFFDKLFGNKKNNNETYEVGDTNSAYNPFYSYYEWDDEGKPVKDDIFNSDIVIQAMDLICSEMSKLTPKHLYKGKTTNTSDISKILKKPNWYMTQSDFLYKITYMLLIKNDCFIYKDYSETNNLIGLYPIEYNSSELREYKNGIFLYLVLDDGKEVELPYNNFIHLRINYQQNKYLAGSPDNKGLLFNLKINNGLMKSLNKNVEGSANVNAIVKYNSMIDDGKTEKAIRRFEEKLKNSKTGILRLDNKCEYIPIQRDLKLVDKDTLEFFDYLILRHYKVSVPVLNGNYTKQQYEAFYQVAIEPLVKIFSEAFTYSIFTQRELDFENEIKFFHKNLMFMTTAEVIEVANMALAGGLCTKNEIREMIGFEPLDTEEGDKIIQSLNYANVNIVDQYQLKENQKESEVEKDEQNS